MRVCVERKISNEFPYFLFNTWMSAVTHLLYMPFYLILLKILICINMHFASRTSEEHCEHRMRVHVVNVGKLRLNSKRGYTMLTIPCRFECLSTAKALSPLNIN